MFKKTGKVELPELPLARDYAAKHNAYTDKVWLNHFADKVMKIDPYLSVALYPKSNLVLVFYGKLVIYKAILNEYNMEDMKISDHIKKIEKTVRLLRLNLIPEHLLAGARQNAEALNRKIGRAVQRIFFRK
jgi:hypothetical protein